MKNTSIICLATILSIMTFSNVVVAEDDHYARSIVIQSLEPNTLGVGGREFKTMKNPFGEGVLVYDPRVRFKGVKRNLIWLILQDEAFPLNGASKNITPTLKWPREAGEIWETTGLSPYSSTDVINSVFKDNNQ